MGFMWLHITKLDQQEGQITSLEKSILNGTHSQSY